MKAIERLNGLKTWAAENLKHEDATSLLHDLNAVIEVVEKLNAKADMCDDLIISLNGAGTFIELSVPSMCTCGNINTHKINTVKEIRAVLTRAGETVVVV